MDPAGAGAGEDRLSTLPVEVLVLILIRLDTAAAAGRTSVLSRCWRRIWAHLPVLRFPGNADPRLVASALAAHEAPISYLHVGTLDATPESVEACLAAAAGRLSGRLIFQNRVSGGNAEEETGAFHLLCFENATAVSLDLGSLCLAMPATGVFARLTELSLRRVRFGGSCELGDAVSLLRCPCLQKLSVISAWGLANLVIHSDSLLRLDLQLLRGLQHLTIVAQALEVLKVASCFGVHGRPVANISTPQLLSLDWLDSYDPTSVQLGNLPQLQQLIGCLRVYASHGYGLNRGFLQLLERFQVIQILQITLLYPKNIENWHFVMEDVTKLPSLMALSISLGCNGHNFGASLFYLLRICSGLTMLVLSPIDGLEVSYVCPPGCVCDRPTGWKTEELSLNCLQEVSIDMQGTDHEVDSVKRLFTWAVVLKRVKINFDSSISTCKVMELMQTLSSFSRPETRVEFYICQSVGGKLERKLAP
ncbi:unnamed protein product [Urochloa humidicola]